MAAPMPMSRPVEESPRVVGWLVEAALGVASSEAVGVEGVKGLMGRVMSTKGPVVPTS